MLNADPVLALLSRALDAAQLRQTVHATNIANVDTEGYHRMEVVYSAELQRQNAGQPALPTCTARVLHVLAEAGRLSVIAGRSRSGSTTGAAGCEGSSAPAMAAFSVMPPAPAGCSGRSEKRGSMRSISLPKDRLLGSDIKADAGGSSRRGD